MVDGIPANFEEVFVVINKFTIKEYESFRPRVFLNKFLYTCVAGDFVVR